MDVGSAKANKRNKMKFCPKCGQELIFAEVDHRKRQKCKSESCDYVFWDNPTPVVAAIVEFDEAVVLVRNKEWPDKIYGLVSGFLERGETPEDGILREVKEELGLEGEIPKFVGYYPFFEMNQIIFAFHIKAQGEITLGEEIVDIRLIHPDRLRPWSFGTGLAIKDWLDERRS
jgi:NADH pyrophosphatase NudC (nudix superfamily)